jgi:hypothetical protein
VECVRGLGGYGLVDELIGHLKWRVFFVIENDNLISLLWIENADDAPPLASTTGWAFYDRGENEGPSAGLNSP